VSYVKTFIFKYPHLILNLNLFDHLDRKRYLF